MKKILKIYQEKQEKTNKEKKEEFLIINSEELLNKYYIL